ncbi:hypothetical protein AAFF_G00300810 [Aldrovandia affinis]|uniref:Uncharacterized protein n=1 Tax=Aldrovandia affinis TaxID=143900 RepID=A0AAD7SQW6_9TELE|nr:hypothetical protein AAFF_G00300810 [Aldrovandia affinis]
MKKHEEEAAGVTVLGSFRAGRHPHGLPFKENTSQPSLTPATTTTLLPDTPAVHSPKAGHEEVSLSLSENSTHCIPAPSFPLTPS